MKREEGMRPGAPEAPGAGSQGRILPPPDLGLRASRLGEGAQSVVIRDKAPTTPRALRPANGGRARCWGTKGSAVPTGAAQV